MDEENQKLNELEHRLEQLSKKQSSFWVELRILEDEIKAIKKAEKNTAKSFDSTQTTKEKLQEIPPLDKNPLHSSANQNFAKPHQTVNEPIQAIPQTKNGLNLEKFIGENLINKIGIVILIIGVAIGAKYSLEHNLIGETTRIVLSYLVGLTLSLLALKLKKNYHSYSAVLLSGGLAVLYFTSYFGYSAYALFPQSVAFALMLILTLLGVLSALKYNTQVIALIGLVGAYAIPFLLKNGSGSIPFFLSYVALINLGILVLTWKKHWTALSLSSFALSWMIFISWYINGYVQEAHFSLSLTFTFIYFVINYFILLSYNLSQKENFKKEDIPLILLNAFIFFILGCLQLDFNSNTDHLLGLFALFNALIHFGFSYVIKKKFDADQSLVYLLIGLAISFISIGILIEVEGPWLSSLLVIQAIVLFWIGRKQSVSFYEKFTTPILLLALITLLLGWETNYQDLKSYEGPLRFLPIWNAAFLNSIFFAATLGFGVFIQRKKEFNSALSVHSNAKAILDLLIPAALVFVVYNSFRLEIAKYWIDVYSKTLLHEAVLNSSFSESTGNPAVNYFSQIWQLNYSLLFASLIGWISIKRFNLNYKSVGFGLIALSLLCFNALGLYSLSELRELYQAESESSAFEVNAFYLYLRYISFVLIGLALWTLGHIRKEIRLNRFLFTVYPPLFHTIVLWILSAELIHLLELSGNMQSYKLGLSILWGVYSMILILVGIWKKKQILRIMAIGLFALTLVKLFVYDISHLNSISKTIVFVCLGVLLLITSFLYNKYKHLITDDTHLESQIDENETTSAD